jgi:hypothetical protein
MIAQAEGPRTSAMADGPGWSLLIPILLIALALRAYGLDRQTLSMDEFTELNIGRSAFGAIVIARDGFPPLYHLILHVWLAIFPPDLAARWLSVLIGTASIWAVWGFARRAGGSRVALCTALLVAVMPFHIWHSQEARAYILYYFFAALALWTLLWAVETNRPLAWGAYIASTLAGCLTQYYFGLIVLVGLVVILADLRGRLRNAFIAHVVLAVGSLPVLWLMRADFSSESSMPFAVQFHPAAIGYALFSFLSGYTVGPSPRDLHGQPAAQAILGAAPWLLLTAVAGGILLFAGLRQLGARRWILFLALATVAPVIVCALAADLVGITFQVRHVIWASIPLMVVMGAGALRARHSLVAAVGVVGLLGLFGVSRYNRLNLPDYQTEDLRGVGHYLARGDRSAPVLVTTGYMASLMRHYLGGGWSVSSVPDVGAAGQGLGNAVRSADSLTAGHSFWLVYTRPFHGDPGGRFLDSLRRSHRLEERAAFPGVVVYSGDDDGPTAGAQ